MECWLLSVDVTSVSKRILPCNNHPSSPARQRRYKCSKFAYIHFQRTLLLLTRLLCGLVKVINFLTLSLARLHARHSAAFTVDTAVSIYSLRFVITLRASNNTTMMEVNMSGCRWLTVPENGTLQPRLCACRTLLTRLRQAGRTLRCCGWSRLPCRHETPS